jgi:hypothetical protein
MLSIFDRPNLAKTADIVTGSAPIPGLLAE